MAEPDVINNESLHRFELQAEGKTAFLTYRTHPGEITMIHTEVPPELEGRGIGGKLARAGLEYARECKLRVVPMCPFVTQYIQRHPEYADLARK